MRRVFVLLVFLLSVLPLVSAAIEFEHPFNKELDLRRPCFNNGTYCSGSAVCNLTVEYPANFGLLLDNQIMTNQNSFHNYTFTATQINRLGVYEASMVCSDGSLNGEDTFEFQVTGDGNESNVFPTELSLLILGLFLIGVGTMTEKLRMFKFLGAILTMVMGVVTLYPGYSGLNYSNLQGLALGSIGIGFGFYFLIQDSFSFDKQVETFSQEDDGRFHG